MNKKQSNAQKRGKIGITALLSEVRQLIANARNAAASAVNTLQVMTNFEIGRRIVEHEQKGAKRAEYGAELLKELSSRLTEEFGKGFSVTNLKLMRQFFLDFCPRIGQTPPDQLAGERKGQALSGILKPAGISKTPSAKSTVLPLSWSHYVLLLTIKDPGERSFYDRNVKLTDENPTVGLLLCKSKKETIVELTLPRDSNIHAREYQLYLPSKELLRKKLVEWTQEAGA